MRFVLVNGTPPTGNPSVRCAISRSEQATCGKSGRTSPTVITIATRITARPLSCFSKTRKSITSP